MTSERGFYMILPSNVQPEFHPSNTSSHYRTTFDHSYNLREGDWEVALTEISMVYNLPTILDETFSIQTKERKIGQSFVFETKPNPEHPKVRYVEKDGVKRSITYNEWLPSGNNSRHFPILIRPYINAETQFVHLVVQCVDDAVADNFYMELKEARKHGFIALNTRPKHYYVGDKVYFQLWPKPLKHGETYTTPHLTPVYTKDATLEIVTMIDSCPTKDIQVNRGNYASPESLVAALNREIKNPLTKWKGHRKTKDDIPATCSYYFGYKEEVNRIMLGVGQSTILTFHKDLHTLLGFSANSYEQGEHLAEKAPLMNRGIYNIYVYCSLCSPIRVGNVMVPLLRAIEIPSASKWGKVSSLRFVRPMYVPINSTTFNSIEIMLRDDTGAPILFHEGRTTITLHLRPRRL